MSQNLKSLEHVRIASLIETILQHPTSVLENERSLMAVKWFDYRFLSPKEANRLFQKTFQKLYQQKFAKYIDAEMARNVQGIHSQTIATNARERSKLVMARQRADASGMSYPVYIEACFDFAAQRSNKRSQLPQPNQLHGNKNSEFWLSKFTTQRWNELISNGLVRIKHPAYLIENYRNLPAQNAYRRFVLDHVLLENIPLHRAIRKFTFERVQLPLEIFKKEFEPSIYDRAIEIIENELRQHPIEVASQPTINKSQLWPTCFGMHYTHQTSAQECISCPLNAACKKVGDFVLTKAVTQTGTADPAAEYTKRLSRNRKREQRMRDKEKERTGKSVLVPEKNLRLSY